ncbi:MAG: 50S ribosomal protein L11 methyltransferase, partial [Planctomycetaceae bacterium]|nr:50S ribosomal protein L11 methyltransferase [Planctomycetaceae bacterium]
MNTRWWAAALTLLAILFVAGYAIAPWLAGPVDWGPLTPVDGPEIQEWVLVDDFDQRLALFPTVFWDPRDSFSLRDLIRETDLVQDKTILEIGTGSGLISLCCLKAGASHVVATDVNPQ